LHRSYFHLEQKEPANKVAEKLHKVKNLLFQSLLNLFSISRENLNRINSPNLVFYITIAVATWSSMCLTLYFTMLMLGIKLSFITVFCMRRRQSGTHNLLHPDMWGISVALRTLLVIFSISNEKLLQFLLYSRQHGISPIPCWAQSFMKEHLKIQDIQKLENNIKE
jgi:hypothetical protein